MNNNKVHIGKKSLTSPLPRTLYIERPHQIKQKNKTKQAIKQRKETNTGKPTAPTTSRRGSAHTLTKDDSDNNIHSSTASTRYCRSRSHSHTADKTKTEKTTTGKTVPENRSTATKHHSYTALVLVTQDEFYMKSNHYTDDAGNMTKTDTSARRHHNSLRQSNTHHTVSSSSATCAC
jgi:hypothetical protein